MRRVGWLLLVLTGTVGCAGEGTAPETMQPPAQGEAPARCSQRYCASAGIGSNPTGAVLQGDSSNYRVRMRLGIGEGL